MRFGRGMILLLWISCGISLIQAQGDSNCVGAPLPRLIVGETGRVLPGEANNMRDVAGLSGTKNGKIPAGSTFSVLAGPVCLDGLNWWQVDYQGLVGWTVEGQDTDYWVEPMPASAPTPMIATNTPPPPTNTPLPTLTPVPAVRFVPPLEAVNTLQIGARARVISDRPGSDRSILRSGPGLYSESLSFVDDGTLLTVLDGPVDADGYFWWKIQTDGGQIGWLIEGTSTARALLPLCPFAENRLAFVVNQYLYTSDEVGANRCIFDLLHQTDYLIPLPKNLVWSPDHQWLTFVDNELYQMSANGSQRVRLTDKSSFYWLDWSPDGQRIATIDERGKIPQVWTMRADGSLLAVLTTNEQRKVWASWLADSETLLYIETVGPDLYMTPPQGYTLNTVSVLAGGFKQLFGTTLAIFMPALSPDKSRLLLSGEDRAAGVVAGGRTYILDARTGDLLLEFPYAFDGIWSPDGTRLISLETDAITTLELVAGSEPIRTPLAVAMPLSDSTHAVFDWLADGRLRVLINGVFYYIDTLTGQVEIGA